MNIEKAKRPCIEELSVHGRFADGHCLKEMFLSFVIVQNFIFLIQIIENK